MPFEACFPTARANKKGRVSNEARPLSFSVIIRILRSSGLTVERHHDHFAPDASDETWLEEADQRGWIWKLLPEISVGEENKVHLTRGIYGVAIFVIVLMSAGFICLLKAGGAI
jgi:hypothetical protein